MIYICIEVLCINSVELSNALFSPGFLYKNISALWLINLIISWLAIVTTTIARHS